MIHTADPKSRLVVIIIFAHISVRPSVPTFQNMAKQTCLKIIIAGGTVGRAERIIDDTFLVSFYIEILLDYFALIGFFRTRRNF